jgi:cell division protein FtsL
MALRIALPRPAEDLELLDKPVEAVRARRLSLRSYLELDPAIRFLIALALVAAISLLYLVQTSTVTDLNYNVQRLQIEHNRLLRTNQQLHLEIARAQSLARVREVAVNKLGMVPVGDQYTYVGVPPANAGADGPAIVQRAEEGAAPPPGPAPDGGGGSP